MPAPRRLGSKLPKPRAQVRFLPGALRRFAEMVADEPANYRHRSSGRTAVTPLLAHAGRGRTTFGPLGSGEAALRSGSAPALLAAALKGSGARAALLSFLEALALGQRALRIVRILRDGPGHPRRSRRCSGVTLSPHGFWGMEGWGPEERPVAAAGVRSRPPSLSLPACRHRREPQIIPPCGRQRRSFPGLDRSRYVFGMKTV